MLVAGYAYGFDAHRYDGYRVLVFDFGGGTFDVCVMEVCKGEFKVRAVDGDVELGGRDLDLELRAFCAERIRAQWRRDCMTTPLAKQKLLDKCEALKIALTSAQVESYVGGIAKIFNLLRGRLCN